MSVSRRAAVVAAGLLASCGGQVTGPDPTSTTTPPLNLFTATDRGLESTLAMSPGGRSIAMWTDGIRLWASDSPDGATWPSTVEFPRGADYTGTSLQPAVELDDEGNGFGAWLESRRSNGVAVVACRYLAGRGWSAPAEVARGEWSRIKELALAVAPAGQAVLAWGGWDNGVLASVWSGESWSPPERLAEGQILVGIGDLEVRLRGRTAAAVWSEEVQGFPAEIHTRVRARVWDVDTGWSPMVELGRSLRRPMPVARPAVDSLGTATFLWGGGPRESGPFAAQTTRHERTQGWQPAQTLGEYSELVGLEAHAGDQLTAVLGRVSAGVGPLAALRHTQGLGWQELGATVSRGGLPNYTYSAQAANAPRTALVAPDGSLWLALPGDPWTLERVPFERAEAGCPESLPPHDPRVAVDATGATVVTWIWHCRQESLFVWRRP